jgi:hypothetical protein
VSETEERGEEERKWRVRVRGKEGEEERKWRGSGTEERG